jgi:transcriptional regulator with XRE-family HTH domain
MQIGDTIREMRKKRGITMGKLAQMVGVSYLTIQRVETNKISPSVALLSEIAKSIGQPIHTFFENKKKKVILIRSNTVPVIGSGKLRLQIIAPKGSFDEKTSISVGEVHPGEKAKIQTRKGFDFFYLIDGRALIKHGSQDFELNSGDAIYYDASVAHAWSALETVRFLAINFLKED